MEKKLLEETYWKTLEKLVGIQNIKGSASSFTFMDTDAWTWSVQLYAHILEDYCKNLPFDRDLLIQHIARTNNTPSKHDQARKILKLLTITDETEEGSWLKRFRRELDQVSGKGGNNDRRSFTVQERPRFLEKVTELAQKVEFTSITLGLALIETAHIRSSDEKRVKKLLEVLPSKAKEFFMPKSHILL